MNNPDALAVVFVYIPSEDRCYHTPFSGEHHEDPLGFAHLFMESEEERGDFPNALWTVTGNEAASEIRKKALMEALFGEEPAARS